MPEGKSWKETLATAGAGMVKSRLQPLARTVAQKAGDGVGPAMNGASREGAFWGIVAVLGMMLLISCFTAGILLCIELATTSAFFMEAARPYIRWILALLLLIAPPLILLVLLVAAPSRVGAAMERKVRKVLTDSAEKPFQ